MVQRLEFCRELRIQNLLTGFSVQCELTRLDDSQWLLNVTLTSQFKSGYTYDRYLSLPSNMWGYVSQGVFELGYPYTLEPQTLVPAGGSVHLVKQMAYDSARTTFASWLGRSPDEVGCHKAEEWIDRSD